MIPPARQAIRGRMENGNGGLVTDCLIRDEEDAPTKDTHEKLLVLLLFLMSGSSQGLIVTFDATIPTRISENTDLMSEVAAEVSPVVIGLQTNVVDGETLVEQVFKVETNEEKVTRQIAKELQSIIRRLFSKADRDIRRRASDSEAENLQDVTVSPR